MLITPFWFWGDDPIPSPCPIFAHYLNDMPVLLQSFHMTPDAFVATVRTNRIAWALLSPPPGTGETTLLGPLVRKYGLTPRNVTGAVIFKTEDLWK